MVADHQGSEHQGGVTRQSRIAGHGAPMWTPASQGYIFGGTDIERQRLMAQAESLELPAQWLLDQIGIQSGWHAIDIGCGPLGILHLLSERVGSGGAVVGLEREARFATMAQNEVVRRKL